MMLKARKMKNIVPSFSESCSAALKIYVTRRPIHCLDLCHFIFVHFFIALEFLLFISTKSLSSMRCEPQNFCTYPCYIYICKDIERITRLHLNRITAFFLHSIMFQFTLRFLFFKCVHFFCEIAFSTCYSLTPPLLAHPVYNLLYLVSNFLSSSLYI